MRLDAFASHAAPGTGRRAVQITNGDAFCYPLYYFIPSITSGNEYLIHHRSDGTEVQLERVDLRSGESRRLTNASARDTQWHPWCGPAGTGVLDHRSVLDTAGGAVIFFDGNTVCSVDVESLATRELFELPADRMAIGQNCCSPDGEWFFYIHHDRDTYRQIYGEPGAKRLGGYQYPRHLSRSTKLDAYSLRTGAQRTVVTLNSPFHHVQPLGSSMLAFSSLAVERAILVTDYAGGWYTHLRTQAPDGGTTCHYCTTDRGIFYEADGTPGLLAGVVDLDHRRPAEFRLPPSIRNGAHVGADQSGRRFFIECHDSQRGHVVVFVRDVAPDGTARVDYLFDDWPAFGEGQKSHFHPRVTPDGRHLVITAGDRSTGSNHIYLVDISDLPESNLPSAAIS